MPLSETNEIKNTILAVVVTYNRLSMLKECVRHILSQSAPCDLLIVDNASMDGTGAFAELLQRPQEAFPCAEPHVPCKGQNHSSEKRNSPDREPENSSTGNNCRIYYENTGRNLGGAGGFNFGLRKACELGYSYAWVMDDDAFATPDCLAELLLAGKQLCASSSAPSFGFLSSAVLWTDGSLCRMNWQRKLHLPKNRNEHHLTEEDLNALVPVPIQSATFVSLLIPTAVIRSVGLPIREFFIWCDDIEFTRRVSLKYGYPCYAVPKSRITHHIANNVGTDLATDSADRIPRYNYAFRNENYMYRQYGVRGFLYYVLVCLYNSLKVLKNAPDHRLRRLSVIFRNFFTGLFFNPPVEHL